jgi:exopolysaccharide production protein ExoQ
MPPIVASAVFYALIALLFWLDRDKKTRTSLALWIPVIWFAIAASRPVSAWLGLTATSDSVDSVMDGSPMDRLVFVILLVLALPVLISRGSRIIEILKSNGALLLFVSYCLLSLAWSDFPGVASKRMIKVLGDIGMVMIVLSETDHLAAVQRFIVRLSFVLVPLSILLMKYYPALGMHYNGWTGTAVYTGVTTNKNTLGALCLCLGLGTLWRFLSAYKSDDATRMKRLIASGIVLAMVLRLFQLMDSKTSMSSFAMASTLLLMANSPKVIKRPAIIHLTVALMFTFTAAVVFLGASPDLLRALGRNPDLTERTFLWDQLLAMVENPVFGTGFESFWLGRRLEWIWYLNPWQPNQAHNGYLETYLNLGWVGILLLLCVLGAGYRTVYRVWRTDPWVGSLGLAVFYVGLVYNFTEAAFFRMQATTWLFFMLVVLYVPTATSVVPTVARARLRSPRRVAAATTSHARVRQQFSFNPAPRKG